ncbi:hypothetical protein [Aquisediminimonas sediminicola]|uniref:hypothetical protein n=1 Tax=Alteraquisediminimonas sediminicola TaxID=2676787 RepID=UPI001C8EDBFB|nr:hypothetical protein [Aquisediminimonas sediminicola]
MRKSSLYVPILFLGRIMTSGVSREQKSADRLAFEHYLIPEDIVGQSEDRARIAGAIYRRATGVR